MGVGIWVKVADAADGPYTDPTGHTNAFVYDSSQDLALVYGDNAETRSWDGIAWSSILATTPNVGQPAVCYDEGNAEIMFFGGVGTTSPGFNKTYTWDWGSNSWTLESPATSPGPRVEAGIAYDAANGEVVMFGGRNSGSYSGSLSETWVWDGTDWTQRTPATVPTARAGFAMAYDAVRGKVVMFGGRSVTNTFLDDTWTWDGTDWTLESPGTTPEPRERFGMCWDSFLGRVFLYGGFVQPVVGPGYLSNESWVWDGTDWTDLTATVNDVGLPPPETQELGLCYFTSRAEVTMLSSNLDGGLTDGDTWALPHTRDQVLGQVMRWW